MEWDFTEDNYAHIQVNSKTRGDSHPLHHQTLTLASFLSVSSRNTQLTTSSPVSSHFSISLSASRVSMDAVDGEFPKLFPFEKHY